MQALYVFATSEEGNKASYCHTAHYYTCLRQHMLITSVSIALVDPAHPLLLAGR